MEKYDPETMAIVPKYPTMKMFLEGQEFCKSAFKSGSTACADDIYKTMINAAPRVEPVVPLSEVLELLLKFQNMDDKFCAKIGHAIWAIKQKYGGSE